MASTSKVIAIGNSMGIILPRETLERLKVRKGDALFVQETPLGLRLTPYNDNFGTKMEAADMVIRRYRDAFRNLAE